MKTQSYFRSGQKKDSSRGIAYSIDGKEPKLQFLTKLEALPERNWYYYEEDFDEWKIQNKK